MRVRSRTLPDARRGSAMMMILVFTAVLVILGAAALQMTTRSVDEIEGERRELQALYSAEAGVNIAFGRIVTAYRTGADIEALLGSVDAPVDTGMSRFFGHIVENGDDTFTIQVTGLSGFARRTLQAVITPVPPGPLSHSMFAGNFSGDNSYSLDLGGVGGQADEVTGDIYSGGDIALYGDSTATGNLRARGTVTGAPGQGGVIVPLPQLLKTDYEQFHDYDVATMFGSATYLADGFGGSAFQLPEASAAHIFRKNPSDRTSDTNATTKDDYFIEDPFESVNTDSAQDGTNASMVTIPADANNSVYFIDGNLWIHSKQTFSFKFANEGSEPTKITFVVKGNIYFSDNVYYQEPDEDGVAFIALDDPTVPDSGNIYFGDPVFGTMKYAEGFMFAENNFYDTNLDASGSQHVTIHGSMTAANQVAIARDYANSNGTVAHTRLDLTFDERQKVGGLNLPGIPSDTDHPTGYVVASWREMAEPGAPPVVPAVIQVDGSGVGIVPEVIGGSGPGSTSGGAAAAVWRDRWDLLFGDAWKTVVRQGKWSNYEY